MGLNSLGMEYFINRMWFKRTLIVYNTTLLCSKCVKRFGWRLLCWAIPFIISYDFCWLLNLSAQIFPGLLDSVPVNVAQCVIPTWWGVSPFWTGCSWAYEHVFQASVSWTWSHSPQAHLVYWALISFCSEPSELLCFLESMWSAMELMARFICITSTIKETPGVFALIQQSMLCQCRHACHLMVQTSSICCNILSCINLTHHFYSKWYINDFN